MGILNNITSIFQKRRKESPSEVALDIMQEVVLNPSSHYFDKSPTDAWKSASEEAKSRYLEKTYLYKTAALLMLLTQVEKDSDKATEVKMEVEKIVFPKNIEEATPLIQEVNNAMKDISKFLDPSNLYGRPLWAMEWLKDTGIDESNPMTLTLFTVWWSQQIILLKDTLTLAINKYM